MQRFILVVVVSWLAFIPVSTLAQGTLYKWVDSRGVAHYTNTPTSGNAKTVDDALPPASNFKRPNPPVESTREAIKPDPEVSAPPPSASNENAPQQATEEPTPAPQPSATDNQQPAPSTAQANQ